ncbi:hypothetical protein L0F63_002475 [Massospora cicadina]|nr:hypothetical protein L0F63_002475 [Massospora cicadina]
MVGEELRALGHSISYVALEDNLAYVAERNFSKVSLGSPGLLSGDGVELWKRWMGDLRGLRAQWAFYAMVREGAPLIYLAEFPPLLRAAQELRPDVMVCDFFSNACKDVAEMLSIPLVVSFQALDWPGMTPACYISSRLWFGQLRISSFFDWLNDWHWFLYRHVHIHLMRRALDGLRKRMKVGTGQPLSGLHYGLGVSTSFLGFEPPQHLPPNLKMIGPPATTPLAPLPADIEEFLNHHKRVMYIGFGSHVQLLESEIKAILGGVTLAIERGAIDSVIWGMGSTPPTMFPQTRPNIFLLKWAPQQQILHHSSTRLILTHGGTESTFEAIHAKTPILCMPFFADQPRNARKLVDVGIGRYIDPTNFTSTSLAEAINEIITDPAYKNHLRRIHAILKSHHSLSLGPTAILDHIRIAKACRTIIPYIPFSGLPPCEPSADSLIYVDV